MYAIPDSKSIKHNFNPRVNPFILATEERTAEKVKAEEVKPVSKIEFEKTKEVNSVSENKVPASEKFCVEPISVSVKNDPLEQFRKKEIDTSPALFKSPEVKLHINEQDVAKTKETEENTDKITSVKQETVQIEIPNNREEDINIISPPVEDNFNIIGQIFETYIIAQRGNEMLVIDQHAAHERIKYEQLLKSLECKQCYPQMLLEPVVIKLDAPEFSAFEANCKTLLDLGFDAEIFGDNEIIVRAAPQES